MGRRIGMASGSALGAVLLFLPPPAHAADDPPSRDWLVTLSLSGHASPEFPGGRKIEVAPIPSISLRGVGAPLPFEAPDQSGGIGLLHHRNGFDFGPVATIRLKRNQEDVGAAVGNVGFTVEAGAFAQAWPVPNLRLRAEGRRGIGGHDGLLGDLSADAVIRDDDRTVFSLGPRLRFADDGFERAYFGISPAASARTGIPVYLPRGGLYAIGALTSLVHQLSRIWGMTTYLGYDRLLRDAGASPIVRRFGSRNQLSGGLGLTYTFAFHRH